MEIAKREVLASISIIAVMLLIGFLISGEISNSIMDDNEKYNKAVKIKDEDLFRYGMDTNIGNAFVYGKLESVDTVTYPEIGGKYIYIEKIEERRERHERKVKKKDSKGKEYTETEVYYSWDTENTESLHAKEIKFCGTTFDYEKIKLPFSKYIKTIPGDKVYSLESGERVKVRFSQSLKMEQFLTRHIFTRIVHSMILQKCLKPTRQLLWLYFGLYGLY